MDVRLPMWKKYWENPVAKTLVFLGALFGIMFVLGAAVGKLRSAVPVEKEQESAPAEKVSAQELLNKTKDWGLGFGKPGEKPRGDVSVEEMAKYNAYYMRDDEEKILYLTFDCGYENGNLEPMLDALKKHGISATFFVVGHFLETAPELAKRMAEDGHTVGNHTYHHPDMSKICDEKSFREEVESVEKKFREITGTEMAKYYRPPQGKFSTENLQLAKDLGYTTFFWSLAYQDWNRDAQPSHEGALKKLTERVHPGAIVLLHSTSKTNGEILDEVLTRWEEMGYSFGTLADFVTAEETAGPISDYLREQ